MQERAPRAKFARLEPESAQFNGLDQKLYEKMTASIKERNTSYVDREDYVEDQEIKLENNKEEQFGTSLRKHWKRKRTKLSLEKDRLKRRRRYRI